LGPRVFEAGKTPWGWNEHDTTTKVTVKRVFKSFTGGERQCY